MSDKVAELISNGTKLIGNQRLGEAIMCFKKALEYEPNNKTAIHSLYLCYRAFGDAMKSLYYGELYTAHDVDKDYLSKIITQKYGHVVTENRDKILSFDRFIELASKDKYYLGRWSYLSTITQIISMLPFENVLEMGALRHAVIDGSDVMDIEENGCVNRNKMIIQDAGNVPWDMPDKSYDLFIASQVWEHLGDKQKEAFAEVKRTSKAALLSFPYMWECPGDIHHGIDEKKIAEWTLFEKPAYVQMIHTKSRRIVYLFLF